MPRRARIGAAVSVAIIVAAALWAALAYEVVVVVNAPVESIQRQTTVPVAKELEATATEEVSLSTLSEREGGPAGGVRVVAQSDIDRAIESVRQNLIAVAKGRLHDQAQKDGLVPTLAHEEGYTPTPITPVGTESPTTRVRVTARVKAGAYRPEQLAAATDKALSGSLPPGRFVVPLSVNRTTRAAGNGQIEVVVFARISPVDAERARRDTAGSLTRSARQKLERRYGDGNVHIQGDPVVLPWLPFATSRVHVLVLPPTVGDNPA